jgi:CheY-like chemotaxis protein
MDLVMPRFDGIYATRRIRFNPETSVIPIICVTSHAGEYEAEAIVAGCNDVFTNTSFMDKFDYILKKIS